MQAAAFGGRILRFAFRSKGSVITKNTVTSKQLESLPPQDPAVIPPL